MATFEVTMKERGKDGVVRTLKQTAVCQTEQQVIDWYGLKKPDILEYKIQKFENPVKLNFTCTECGKTVEVTVEQEDLEKWQKREDHIQNCFPYLSPGERELFLSGLCDDCFNEIFAEHMEEE